MKATLRPTHDLGPYEKLWRERAGEQLVFDLIDVHKMRTC